MKPDCRNDCSEPTPFPRRIANRPGLSRVDYRIGTYEDFKEAIFQRLNKSEVLAGWSHREADDPGIALLEGAAVLGDILTLYQEVYANEAFLHTAQWRESIADLVRLTGYRLSPGTGGRATFAFEVRRAHAITIPAGFPVKAQVEGLEGPTTFETEEKVEAYPGLSRFHLYRPCALSDIEPDTAVFSVCRSVLEQEDVEIGPGDRLLLVEDPADPVSARQLAVVDRTEEQFDRLVLAVQGGWRHATAVEELHAYKLGRSFRHFGYNGPPKKVVVEDESAVSVDVSFARKLQNIPGTISPMYLGYYALSRFEAVPLDSEVDDLAAGTTMLVELQLGGTEHVSSRPYFFERTVENVESASLTWGAMTGGTTVITLDAAPIYGANYFTDIRSVTLHEVAGGGFKIQGKYSETHAAELSTLFAFCTPETYRHFDRRTLLFVKEDGTAEKTSVTVDEAVLLEAEGETLRPLHLAGTLERFQAHDFPLSEEPRVTVFGNLVAATQGATEQEAVLGNGDGREAFQTFKLPKAPLTFLTWVGVTPPEVPELEVFVDGRRWEHVPSFFGQPADAEVYVVRQDAGGDSWVQFGDGKTGRRLPSGVQNVTARYRTGTGAYGAQRADTTVQAGRRLEGLDKIQLPEGASGGEDPEDSARVREAAPGKMQSLGRLVSLADYQSEAAAIAGVSLVQAVWDLVDSVPTLVLTVLMERGRGEEVEEVRRVLADYNRCKGARRFPVYVQQGRRTYVYLDLTVALRSSFREEMVKRAVRDVLMGGEAAGAGRAGLFTTRERQFGESAYATRIEGKVQAVEGVAWVKVTALGVLGEAGDPADLFYPPTMKEAPDALPCDSDRVLSLDERHLQVSIVRGGAADSC